MIHRRPEEFDNHPAPALYELVAPTVVKARSTSEPKLYAVGTVLEVGGLAHASFRPLNREATHAKFHSVAKAAATPAWYTVAVLTAVSLGGVAGTYEDAAAHVQNWLDDYVADRKGVRRGF